MKHLNPNQTKIIELLAEGDSLSGNALGHALGVSRTAIWKHIKHMTELGIPIVSHPKQGYRLPTPMHLLNATRIQNVLQNSCQLHLFSQIDSTNHFLKQRCHNLTSQAAEGFTLQEICCSETQTAGRGRFGRTWHSPFGENIYYSSRWYFNGDLSLLSGLSLVVSMAITATLADLRITDNIRIKWPNDVLWHHKKLCGSLIELIAESHGGAHVVVGIGLNVNTDTNTQNALQLPWCSLHEITGDYFDRNLIIGRLTNTLNTHLSLFSAQGLAPFMPTWQTLDYLYGQSIRVSHPSAIISGTAEGINSLGQLILRDEHHTTHYLASGDTSLNLDE